MKSRTLLHISKKQTIAHLKKFHPFNMSKKHLAKDI